MYRTKSERGVYRLVEWWSHSFHLLIIICWGQGGGCESHLRVARHDANWAGEELAASGADVGDVIVALHAIDDLGAGVSER
jgi:hypothetical protein